MTLLFYRFGSREGTKHLLSTYCALRHFMNMPFLWSFCKRGLFMPTIQMMKLRLEFSS